MDPLNILIVDDSPTGREQLLRLVKEMGHQPHAAASGQEALAALETGGFDLVLCDLVMPDLDGLEVLDKVRGQGWNIPFILVTAHASLKSAVAALRRGADDYLMRPVDREILEHRVASVLRGRQAEKARQEKQLLQAALATARGATHELNQPLTALMASAELIATVAEPDRIKPLADLILVQAKRLGKITHRLENLVSFQTTPYLGEVNILDLEASAPERDEV